MTHVIESSLSGQVEKYHLRTISACSCFHPSTAGFSFFSSLVFNLLTPELWGCWVVVIVQVWKGALMHLLAMNLLDCTLSSESTFISVHVSDASIFSIWCVQQVRKENHNQ